MRRNRGLLHLGAMLSLVAALMHALAAPDHFAEWWGYGAFMTAAVVTQAGFAAALLWASSQRALEWIAASGIIGNVAIMALYIVTRTLGTPLGPGAGEVEPVGEMGGIDVISTLAEIALVVALIAHTRVRPKETRVSGDDTSVAQT